jgi:DNA replication initiation complex subunit (GINS family)
MAEMTYERLRKVQADEREGSALTRLPPDFYESVRIMVSERRERLNSKFSLSDAKEFENTLKILKDIFTLREQKMVLRALATAGGARDGSALSPEERAVFDRIVEVLEERKAWVEGLLEGKEGGGARKQGKGKVRVRILVPIPEYVGADGRKYGPFEPKSRAELPEGEAGLLIKRKAAEAA